MLTPHDHPVNPKMLSVSSAMLMTWQHGVTNGLVHRLWPGCSTREGPLIARSKNMGMLTALEKTSPRKVVRLGLLIHQISKPLRVS